jgi:hypothetical protein
LDYAMARFYNSRIGGFCSVDPLEGRPNDPLSWNRYAYVENDPINLTDPSGQGLWSWIVRILTALVSVISGILFPPSIAIVPTIGGGIDLLTLLPGYNPHRAMTPPFLSSSLSPSLSSWVAATATSNGPGAANLAALGACTSSVFSVALKSFTASTSTTNGSFTGVKAGIYTGSSAPDAAGPFQFTVTNDTSMGVGGVTASYYIAGNTTETLPGGAPCSHEQDPVLHSIAGFVDPCRPFMSYTANNVSDVSNYSIVQIQIRELGNALGYITHSAPSHLSIEPGPGNNEPGQSLLDCYEAKIR